MATVEVAVENAAAAEPLKPIVEEGTDQETIDDGSLKRKASDDIAEDESPKRAKHDSDSAAGVEEGEVTRRSTSPIYRHSKEILSHDGRDRRQIAAQEEKKRGKRLFGGLMSTLSQTSNNSQQHKRRQEIERRQHERIQKESAEDDHKRTEKRERLRDIRMTEQIVFDEQVMNNKHAKQLAMARFLRTRSEPHIHYLPWKTTSEQEDTIDDQISEAKASIAREAEQFKTRKQRHIQRYGPPSRYRSPTPERPAPESLAPSPTRATENISEEAVEKPAEEEPKEERKEHHPHHHNDPHDESGDVLVEAEEDMVIY